jgi:hypothetical protein
VRRIDVSAEPERMKDGVAQERSRVR